MVNTQAQARAFLETSGFCLRYGANPSLPIPSFFQAVFGDTKAPSPEQQGAAVELTNQLLGAHEAIEVTVIAGRVCLVHRRLVPALHRLVRRSSSLGGVPELSPEAKEVLALLAEKGEIVTGDVRRLLGMPSVKSDEDPAYAVLGELQRHFLVDRGPFKVSNRAMPYLAREGYPYHLFTEAHLELARAGEAMSWEDARAQWLGDFLKERPECPVRKLASLFKGFLTREEIQDWVSAPGAARGPARSRPAPAARTR